MLVDLVVLSTEDQIGSQILRSLSKQLNEILKFSKYDILRRTKDLVESTIKNSAEYRSLLGGQLQAELGVPESNSKLGEILDIWLNEIYITNISVRIFGASIAGGFTLKIAKSNLSGVLNSPAAVYITDKGEQIPWLQWLLTAGDSTIIRDYTVRFTNPINSRTGLAIMVGDQGNNWNVPPQFSGTRDNNWLTRSLDKIIPDIEKIIEEEVLRQANKP